MGSGSGLNGNIAAYVDAPEAYDVITHYASEKITSNARLIELTSHTNTPAVPLIILRAGQPITLAAQPGKLGVQLE